MSTISHIAYLAEQLAHSLWGMVSLTCAHTSFAAANEWLPSPTTNARL